ncbi:MAG: DUF6962 family protein [Methylobacter sp.]
MVAIVAVFSLDPIAQNPDYHNFADQRHLVNIAYFYNVLSNLPLIVIGMMGLLRRPVGGLEALRRLYLTFFAGVFLTGLGSMYYHLEPNNQTLLWDRLPMTVAFMAFFCVIVGEYRSVRLARRLCAPLLIVGLVSVVYWYVTELHGQGDLRAYALVQFLPLVLIPVILWQSESTLNGDTYRWGVVGAYAIAKLMEVSDAEIYRVSGLLSGHSLKHLVAAGGVLVFYWGLRKRH